MKGLILCAGLGTRLKPLTNKIPKVMVKVGGKPVLEHLIKHLNNFGITKIMINVHHKPRKIMNHFGTRLLYLYEPKLLGKKGEMYPEGTLQVLKPWMINEYTVVMNGDTLTNVNITKMFRISKGDNIRYMDKDGQTYAGTMIVSPSYFYGNKKFLNFQSAESFWIDMGNFDGLKKARKLYANICESETW